MNLDELRQAMASDATIENERLKNEINILREKLNKTKSEYEEFKKYMTNDCRALANRCWTLTGGTMCCFCALDEFKCPHAWSDEKKIEAANRCWTLTGGTMCCFCALDEFKCPHAWSDEKKIEAAKIMRREFDNAEN